MRNRTRTSLLLLLFLVVVQSVTAQHYYRRAYWNSHFQWYNYLITEVHGLKHLQNNEFAIVGTSTDYTSSLNWDPHAFALFIDSMGDVSKMKLYGTNGYCVAKSAAAGIDSSLFIAGINSLSSHGNLVFATKVNINTGDTIWSRYLDVGSSEPFINRTHDAGCVIAFKHNTTLAVVRLNNNGDTLWCKRINNNFWSNTIFSPIIQRRNGNFLLHAGNSNNRMLVTELNGNGQFIKNHTYDFPSNFQYRAVQIVEDSVTGNIYTAGTCYFGMAVCGWDSSMTLLWAKRFRNSTQTGGQYGSPKCNNIYLNDSSLYVLGEIDTAISRGMNTMLELNKFTGDTFQTWFARPLSYYHDGDNLYKDMVMVGDDKYVGGNIGIGGHNRAILDKFKSMPQSCDRTRAEVIVTTHNPTLRNISKPSILGGMTLQYHPFGVGSVFAYDSTFCETFCADSFHIKPSYVLQGNAQVQFYDSTAFVRGRTWYFGNGDSSSTQNPVYTYASQGTYNVCLKVWDDCGSDSICFSVNTLGAGMKEHEDFEFTFYPNPSRDEIIVRASESVSEVIIYDIDGRLLMRTALNQENTRIDLAALSKGAYLITGYSKGLPVVTQRFFKVE